MQGMRYPLPADAVHATLASRVRRFRHTRKAAADTGAAPSTGPCSGRIARGTETNLALIFVHSDANIVHTLVFEEIRASRAHACVLDARKRSRGKLIENQWVNFLGFAHRFC